jgi:PAS domain S-box-containing protein
MSGRAVTEGHRERFDAATQGPVASQLVAHLELAPDAIFARDRAGRITFWNRGAEEMYGFDRERALFSRAADLLRTEYPIPVELIERSVAETGEWSGELVQHASDGRRIVVESRWGAYRGPRGELLSMLEVNRDVSGRLRTEAALLELAPDAFVGTNPDGAIVLANAQTEALFGYPRDELLGKPVEMLIPAASREKHVTDRGRYFENPRTRPMGEGLELRGRHRDGSEFPAEISLASVHTESAGVVAIAIVRDVSERVAAANERERLLAAAERERVRNHLHERHRLESLGQLAGGIAHDFNNLLAVVLSYADLAAQSLQNAPAGADGDRMRSAADDLHQITDAGQRAAELTHQLLAFARSEVGAPQVIYVGDVIGELEPLLRRTLGEHIELGCEIADALPPVRIDPTQLGQVLVNLAVNARDAMPGGGTLGIEAREQELDEEALATRSHLEPGRFVSIRVSDTGCGMPPDVADRAFDPFFTTKPSGAGTGLGLATVHGILHGVGGDVRIYSEPQIGTTVSLMLPAVEEEPARHRPAPATAGPQRTATILLVEDEPALLDGVRRMLAAAGHSVLAYSSGREALAGAREYDGEIDLLLSDVIMPQMPGPALAAELRSTHPQLPVLFMSGFADSVLAATDLVGDTDVIQKPFSGQDLLSRIEAVLAR